MKNIAILYHDVDLDGKISHEICLYHLATLYPKARIHSFGWDYGRPLPVPFISWWDPELGDQFSNKWEDFDAIYIVDLSNDELMARPELHNKMVWIDHHISAIEKWDAGVVDDRLPPPFNGLRINDVAACRLCWQWFTHKNTSALTKKHFTEHMVEEPTLVRLVGEYDVWDLRDPNAKILNFGLKVLDNTALHHLAMEAMESFTAGPLTNLYPDSILAPHLERGFVIKTYVDMQSQEYSALCAHTLHWEGLKFCVLNTGQFGNSDLLMGGIKPEHDACFAWRHTGEFVRVSLYHIQGKECHDLRKIAVKYGGGGHKGACGFRMALMDLASLLSHADDSKLDPDKEIVPIADFVELCQSGVFTSDDGIAYFCDSDGRELWNYRPANPADANLNPPPGATHVAMYGK